MTSVVVLIMKRLDRKLDGVNMTNLVEIDEFKSAVVKLLQ